MRGGKRIGAGRPPLGETRGKMAAYWLPVGVIDWIAKAAPKAKLSKSRFVAQILEKELSGD